MSCATSCYHHLVVTVMWLSCDCHVIWRVWPDHVTWTCNMTRVALMIVMWLLCDQIWLWPVWPTCNMTYVWHPCDCHVTVQSYQKSKPVQSCLPALQWFSQCPPSATHPPTVDRETNVQSWTSDQAAILQATVDIAPAMCTAPCGWSHPPPSVPPFLLMQNLRISAQCDVTKSALWGLHTISNNNLL